VAVSIPPPVLFFLKSQYEITGFFMQLAQPDIARQRRRVEDIAARIGIELRIIDLSRPFAEKILAYFSGSYFDGLTPKPLHALQQGDKIRPVHGDNNGRRDGLHCHRPLCPGVGDKRSLPPVTKGSTPVRISPTFCPG